jgi:16S rRNA (guanine(527)-N(7))-methyltransferase RsmG
VKHDQDPPLPDLTPVQVELLHAYTGLLKEFGPRTGLIGPAEEALLFERHVLDSLRAGPCLYGVTKPVVDLGSGAGLPGIPLAIASPGLPVVLVEPQRRRVAFLELAVERLGLRNVTIQESRVEAIQLTAGACVARAFAAPLPTWLAASRLLNSRGFLLYYAGRSWSLSADNELSEAGAVTRICSPPRLPGQGPILDIRARPRRSEQE